MSDSLQIPPKSPAFRPRSFAQILQHLRMRRQLTTQQLTRIVHCSQQTIEAYETRTLNPSIKMLGRYIVGLELTLTISTDGITITDPATGEVVLHNWPVESM